MPRLPQALRLRKLPRAQPGVLQGRCDGSGVGLFFLNNIGRKFKILNKKIIKFNYQISKSRLEQALAVLKPKVQIGGQVDAEGKIRDEGRNKKLNFVFLKFIFNFEILIFLFSQF